MSEDHAARVREIEELVASYHDGPGISQRIYDIGALFHDPEQAIQLIRQHAHPKDAGNIWLSHVEKEHWANLPLDVRARSLRIAATEWEIPF